MPVEIITIKNNPVDSNCYLIFDKDINDRCLIIDPGSKDISPIEKEIESRGLKPEFIILTHEHFDHVWGCSALAVKYGAFTWGSPLCLENIKSKRLNCSRFYDDVGFVVNVPAKAIEEDETTICWNGYELEFQITPGHSDGSICLSMYNKIFTGDTLIYGLKTVTNILSGSQEKLKSSLETLKRIQGLGYLVYPGHGEAFELDTYNLDKTLK